MSYSVDFSIFINCKPDKVYKYLTDQDKLSLWFTPQVITVPVEKTVAAFAFEFDMNFKMELTTLKTNKLVEWSCIDGYKEWLDSKVRFELFEKDKGTQLKFSHSGLVNEDKKYKTTESWDNFLQELKNICESRNFLLKN